MMTIAPSKLYETPELREQLVYQWNPRVPLEQMLTAADIVADKPDPVLFLDELEDTDKEGWCDARTVLTTLPAKVIFDNYGEEMLGWAATNAIYMGRGEELREGLGEHANFDPSLFEKGRLWSWQKNSSSKGKEVLSQYYLMDALTNGTLDEVDLPAILKQAALEGVEISEKRAKDYSLAPLRSEDASTRPDGPALDWYGEVEPGVSYGIWLDAPMGFALMYKGKPNAVVGLAMSDSKEVMIYQLQGVKADRVNSDKKYTDDYVIGSIGARGLAPIDWQQVMVEAVGQFAQSIEAESIGIQSGEHNKWRQIIMVNETEPHLARDCAERAYDVPAQRLGFTRNFNSDGDWHRAPVPSQI